MKQKTKLVSAAEYARLRNLTPSLIYREIRKGIIRTQDGKIMSPRLTRIVRMYLIPAVFWVPR